jgi:hypothetical protein
MNMDHIYEPNEQFEFNSLSLSPPVFMNSGNYFIKYLYHNAPLYIQAPKCVTKQGVIKGGKKLYCDLLFTNEHESFIRWMEDLENYSQKYIYENRTKWFENDLEMHDIENSFTPPLKIYKSGKFYILRTIIPTRLGKCMLKIYDENENDLEVESIKDGTNVVSIWEIQGIKCSSKNFQIEIEIKQMMVIQPPNLFEKCLLARGGTTAKPSTESTSSPIEDTITEPVLEEEPEVIIDPVSTNLESLDVTVDNKELSPQNVVDATDLYGTLKQIYQDEPSTYTSQESPKNDITEFMYDNHHNIGNDANDNGFYSNGNDEDEDADDESTIEVLEIDQEETIDDPQNLDKSIQVVNLDNTPIEEVADISLKDRNDMYYEIYMEAKKNATASRNLAILEFLEAKGVKDLYRIRDFLGEDTDDEEDDT